MNKKRLKPTIFLLKNRRGQNKSFSLCNFRLMPKNRRGSHVGAMLSFVIFITFIIFLYSILQPALKLETDKEDMVDYLTSELRENFSSDALSLTMTVTELPPGTCITVTNILIGIQEQGLDKNLLIIKDSANSNLPFLESGNDLSIKIGAQFDGFLKIYSSKDIDSSKCPAGNCGISGCPVSDQGYLITSVGQMNETFLKKVITFKNNYEQNPESYETIKEQLSVPENIEFSFELKTTEGTIITPGNVQMPGTANVYVRETPILYVDENANLESGFLTVKVW